MKQHIVRIQQHFSVNYVWEIHLNSWEKFFRWWRKRTDKFAVNMRNIWMSLANYVWEIEDLKWKQYKTQYNTCTKKAIVTNNQLSLCRKEINNMSKPNCSFNLHFCNFSVTSFNFPLHNIKVKLDKFPWNAINKMLVTENFMCRIYGASQSVFLILHWNYKFHSNCKLFKWLRMLNTKILKCQSQMKNKLEEQFDKKE